ncbi:hypothetical protein [Nocardia otitidiscaviarum]|uniref:hypothetical protein n=1 Tax=Nocardia otitidiscaviarum TaxID=1823 RepID=UPI001893B50A|nr:hypothetical protein [Nocardia otitidiscaviarum]MBF6178099.1 hypothetical protein [Nocardia otitidiscaviarum]
MNIATALAAIEDALNRPFPKEKVDEGCFAADQSGPGCHLLDLACANDCFDLDDDLESYRAAQHQYDSDLADLQTALRARWGEGELLTLWGDSDLPPPVQVAEYAPVLRMIAEYIPALRIWRRGERWIGVFVGQEDRELPLQLRVAVGLVSELP